MTKTTHFRSKIACFTVERAAEFARAGVISGCLTPSKLTEASDGRHVLCVNPANHELPFVNIVDFSLVDTAETWTNYRVVVPFVTDLSIPERIGGLFMSIDHETPVVGPAFKKMVYDHYSDETVAAWRVHVIQAIQRMQRVHGPVASRAA